MAMAKAEAAAAAVDLQHGSVHVGTTVHDDLDDLLIKELSTRVVGRLASYKTKTILVLVSKYLKCSNND